METNHQWQNYWLWLNERGQVLPQFLAERPVVAMPPGSAEFHEQQITPISDHADTHSFIGSHLLAAPKLSGFGSECPAVLFVGDAPMQTEESNMMIKMIKAINLNPFSDTFVSDFFDGINGWPSDNQFKSAHIDLFNYIDNTPALQCIVSLGVGGARVLYGIEKDLKPLKSQWLETTNSRPLDCIATFHPRDMIKRPESKIPAWEDLQSIKSRLNLEMDSK